MPVSDTNKAGKVRKGKPKASSKAPFPFLNEATKRKEAVEQGKTTGPAHREALRESYKSEPVPVRKKELAQKGPVGDAARSVHHGREQGQKAIDVALGKKKGSKEDVKKGLDVLHNLSSRSQAVKTFIPEAAPKEKKHKVSVGGVVKAGLLPFRVPVIAVAGAEKAISGHRDPATEAAYKQAGLTKGEAKVARGGLDITSKVLDAVNKPGGAVVGALDNATKKKNIVKGAEEGFKDPYGKHSFKDIVKTAKLPGTRTAAGQAVVGAGLDVANPLDPVRKLRFGAKLISEAAGDKGALDEVRKIEKEVRKGATVSHADASRRVRQARTEASMGKANRRGVQVGVSTRVPVRSGKGVTLERRTITGDGATLDKIVGKPISKAVTRVVAGRRVNHAASSVNPRQRRVFTVATEQGPKRVGRGTKDVPVVVRQSQHERDVIDALDNQSRSALHDFYKEGENLAQRARKLESKEPGSHARIQEARDSGDVSKLSPNEKALNEKLSQYFNRISDFGVEHGVSLDQKATVLRSSDIPDLLKTVTAAAKHSKKLAESELQTVVKAGERSVRRAERPADRAEGAAKAVVPPASKAVLRKDPAYVEASAKLTEANDELRAAQKNYGNLARDKNSSDDDLMAAVHRTNSARKARASALAEYKAAKAHAVEVTAPAHTTARAAQGPTPKAVPVEGPVPEDRVAPLAHASVEPEPTPLAPHDRAPVPALKRLEDKQGKLLEAHQDAASAVAKATDRLDTVKAAIKGLERKPLNSPQEERDFIANVKRLADEALVDTTPRIQRRSAAKSALTPGGKVTDYLKRVENSPEFKALDKIADVETRAAKDPRVEFTPRRQRSQVLDAFGQEGEKGNLVNHGGRGRSDKKITSENELVFRERLQDMPPEQRAGLEDNLALLTSLYGAETAPRVAGAFFNSRIISQFGRPATFDTIQSFDKTTEQLVTKVNGRLTPVEVKDVEIPKAPDGSLFILPKTVFKDIAERHVLHYADNPNLQTFDRVLRSWKVLNTVATPAFFSTSMVGNAFQAWAHDVKFADMAQASKAISALAFHEQTGKLLLDEGQMRKTLTELLGGGTVPVNGVQTPVEDIVAEAIHYGAIRTGGARAGDTASEISLVRQGHNAATRKHRPIEALGNLSENIDDALRLSLYFSYRRDGISPERAVLRLSDATPDYGRLTEAERRYFKRLVPFYIFTARNLPIQVKQAVRNPGKVAQFERFRNAITAEVFGGGDPNSGKTAGDQRRMVIGDGRHPMFSKFPIEQLGTQGIPGLLGGAAGAGVAAQSLASGLNPALKGVAELAFNQRLDFQRPIDKGQSVPIKGPELAVARLLESLGVPATRGKVVDPKTGETHEAVSPKFDYIFRSLGGRFGSTAASLSSADPKNKDKSVALKRLISPFGMSENRQPEVAAGLNNLYEALDKANREKTAIKGQPHKDLEYVKVSDKINEIQNGITRMRRLLGDERVRGFDKIQQVRDQELSRRVTPQSIRALERRMQNVGK